MGEVKIFGPYKGSKQNGGRPIYVIKRKKKDGSTETTSTNKARLDYKKATAIIESIPKTKDVVSIICFSFILNNLLFNI